MAIGITYEQLTELRPCKDDFKRVTKLMGGAKKWNGKSIDAAAARAAGATFDDILWAAAEMARTDKAAERRLRLWMADCAALVLHIFERDTADDRPRNAIIASRQFARGEIGAATRDAAWDAARAATRDAARAATRDAARDAAWDAARAATRDATRDATWAAARDATWAATWAAARDAAWAATWAAARDATWDAARAATWAAASDAAWDAGEQWQFDRLILWLSDNEPEDWPLPEQKQEDA